MVFFPPSVKDEGENNDIVSSASKDAAAGHPAVSVSQADAKTRPYINDDYVAIAWPTTYRTLKNDLEQINQYTESGFNLIHNGEIGRYENVRFIEQTHIPKGAKAANYFAPYTQTPTALNNTDWVFFFGEDTVAEGIVIPEEMRGKIPSDYGRSKGIAWYGLEGFGLTQGASAAQVAQSRICKWDSLA